MASVTQPLRDEHRELLPHIENLRAVADMIGETPADELRSHIDTAYDFLAHHLIPHAQAEDVALYPVVADVMGAPEATATMRRDHVEVGRLIEELAAYRSHLRDETITLDQARRLRRVMYGLYAVIKLHFAKEEEVYLPLLDARLSPEAAHEMFEAMEKAAHEAMHSG